MTAINEQKPLELKLGVKGHFKLIKGDGETGEEVVVADFDNLITDQGLDWIMNSTAWVRGGMCKVGTGSTAPTIHDMQLQTGFARQAWGSYTYETDSTLLTKTITCQCLFPVGTFDSTVISEIGSGTSAANYLIGSRALVLDDFGSPTTITLLSTEYLRVYYSLTIQAPTEDITGSFTMGSLGSIGYTARVGRWLHPSASVGSNTWSGYIYTTTSNQYNKIKTIYSSDAVLGAVTGNPTSSSQFLPYNYWQPKDYVSGNFYRDYWCAIGVNDQNTTPNTTIGAVGFALFEFGTNYLSPFSECYGGFQILFDPYITKVYTRNELYCALTLKLRISIARV